MASSANFQLTKHGHMIAYWLLDQKRLYGSCTPLINMEIAPITL